MPKEYAPGIPDKKKKTPIPSAENTEWEANIQEHLARKAGRHFDLRLNPKGSDKALSWAIRNLPKPGEKTLAIRQPDHTRDYMGFSGEIPEGYGAGKVNSVFKDKIDILKARDNVLEFNMYPGTKTERYFMLNKPKTDDWLIYNYTPRNDTKEYSDVPTTKSSYKSISPEKLEFDREDEVWAPKIDGAHNLVVLRPSKRPDVFSYRKSKKGDEKLDHTFRTRLKDKVSPESLKKTILRSELYIPGGRGSDTARVLNSSVHRSRELQESGKPLEVSIFDVVKFKGKNVENAPYREKLEMLKEVQKEFPDLKTPPLASTKEEKKKMFSKIMSGKDALTSEGVVVFKGEESVPLKVKKRDDYDAKIVGTFPARKGSKYEGKAIGGFLVLPEGKGQPIRVGSGLDDKTREEAFKHPYEYIGQWAQIHSQSVHKSGKHQAPIFKDIRSEKMEKKATLNILTKHMQKVAAPSRLKIEKKLSKNVD